MELPATFAMSCSSKMILKDAYGFGSPCGDAAEQSDSEGPTTMCAVSG